MNRLRTLLIFLCWGHLVLLALRTVLGLADWMISVMLFVLAVLSGILLVAALFSEEFEQTTISNAAKQRAYKTFLSYLSESQVNDLIVNNSFTVVGNVTGRCYEISTKYYLMNIICLDTLETFCIVPAKRLPKGDIFLIQKLIIENDEETFLKIANRI